MKDRAFTEIRNKIELLFKENLKKKTKASITVKTEMKIEIGF